MKMDDWTMFEEFIKIYTNTMSRISADQYYMFSDTYFAGLRSILGDCLHLCTVMSPGGELAAGGLFAVTERVVQYHLGGTSKKYLPLAPAKLMFHSVIRWAKEVGNEIFHLGGGIGGRSDSLFSFKNGFSKLRSDFYTYRMILDDDRYAALVHLSRENCDRPTDYDREFFPAYRDLSITQKVEGARSCPEYQK